MIARTWHGRVLTKQSDDYYAYLLRTGLKDYASVSGNRGVQVLRRTEGQVTHFLVLTLWESYAAIEAFAGESYEEARYYPEDREYLLELEPYVVHYEVVSST